MEGNKDEYFKTVQNWLLDVNKKRISRQNTRHPIMMYLRTKADDKYKEAFPNEKSVFDENVTPNQYHLKYIYPTYVKYTKLKEFTKSSYSMLKVGFYKFQNVYKSLYGKLDDYYLDVISRYQNNNIENKVKQGKFSKMINRIKEMFPNQNKKIENEKDEVLKEIYKREMLNIKIINELRIIRFKNVFAESFFIKKTYVVENAFKQIEKEAQRIDKYYTIFYKLYKISLGQISINPRKMLILFPYALLGILIKFRYDYYKKSLKNKSNNISKERQIYLFEKDLDEKFSKTYLIEQELLESSVSLNDYTKNKEVLETKYKDSHHELIQFFDELMMSDLKFLMFNLFFGFLVFSFSFIYLKRKKNTWKKSLIMSTLFFYIYREFIEYFVILQYLKNQDQLSRFILTNGDPNKENLEELFKYQFFRKNFYNL